MINKCIGFEMKNSKKALKHIKDNWNVIKMYDKNKYDHPLHTWDDGKRVLGKCKACNQLILLQRSEFHSPTGNDSYYEDYFPVSSVEEAEELNKKFDGYDIECNFDKKWLCVTNSRCNWINDKK